VRCAGLGQPTHVVAEVIGTGQPDSEMKVLALLSGGLA
jgi:hypothetical protein